VHSLGPAFPDRPAIPPAPLNSSVCAVAAVRLEAYRGGRVGARTPMVREAKKLVIDGIIRGLPQAVASGLLDSTSPDPSDPGKFVGTTAAGGASEAHRRLKLYVARTPALLHVRPDAVSELEHEFCTGDEVELGGEQNLIVGVHQAIKYRSLAAAERTITSPVRMDPGRPHSSRRCLARRR